MLQALNSVLPTLFAFAGIFYLGLAVRVSRSEPDSLTALLLFLIGILIVGSAFSYDAVNLTLFTIGRVLTFVAGGFIPVAMYLVYREYTTGRPSATAIAILSIIPMATVALALTNSWHHLIWTIVEAKPGAIIRASINPVWFKQVFVPFAFGLFAYSVVALAGHLPTIARAHRNTVLLLIGCAATPFFVSAANNLFGIGASAYPVTALALTMMLPFYAYVSFSKRVYRFSPLAYPTVFDQVRDPIFVLDTDHCIICANKSAQKMLGATESELVGRQLWKNFPEAQAILDQASELDLTQTLKLQKDITYEVSVAPLAGADGKERGTVVVCRDVTDRRKALQQLAQSEHLIRTLIDTSSNGMLRFSREQADGAPRYRCVLANPAAHAYLATLEKPIVSGSLLGMELGELDALDTRRMLKYFESPEGSTRTLSFEVLREKGDRACWLRILCEPVGDDFSVTLIDITQRKLHEDKILDDAIRDPLTGVLNRRGFEKSGAECVRQFASAAVLYMDLNQFKSVNDSFGHQAGDALLKAFGRRLESCLRPEDVLGRLGGDEFAIVLPGIGIDDARHVAERLVQSASDAYIIQGKQIHCSASVGIALMPKHGEDLWHLLSVADQAMYNAKELTLDAANDRAAYVAASVAS